MACSRSRTGGMTKSRPRSWPNTSITALRARKTRMNNWHNAISLKRLQLVGPGVSPELTFNPLPAWIHEPASPGPGIPAGPPAAPLRPERLVQAQIWKALERGG